MRGRLYECLLVRNHALSQPAVTCAPELLHSQLRLNPSIAPAREVGSGNAVADHDASDTLTHGDHLAGTVADRHDALDPRQGVLLMEDQKISVVQRARADTDDSFVRAWLGRRIVLVKDDPI